MNNRFRGKTEQEKHELEQNKLIKPKLKKFVIEEQRKTAAKVAKEKAKEKETIKNLNLWEAVIRQGCKLAMVAFMDKKLWLIVPPAVEMKWITQGAISSQLQMELDNDMAGFGSYLAREYLNFIKLKDQNRGYPNPMKEENLMFFWQKFNADLRLLIAADTKRKATGNKSIIVVDPKEEKK